MKYARIYANGCCLDMGLPGSPDNPESENKGGGKRGRLNGKFSAASFRRLRSFCITHDCDGDCWGITLTIPASNLHWFWVRDYVHRLSVWANYRAVPLIWRCEMQQRGQAHLHIVCYCNSYLCVMLLIEWQNLLIKSGKVLSDEFTEKGEKELVWVNRMFVRGAHHAFYMERLSGDYRSWRYLVAHQSKGKQSQQGWLGRQWGVVNRGAFALNNGIEVALDDKRAFAVRRWVRRLTRRKISNHGRNYLLINPDTLQSMINFVKSEDYYSIPF